MVVSGALRVTKSELDISAVMGMTAIIGMSPRSDFPLFRARACHCGHAALIEAGKIPCLPSP